MAKIKKSLGSQKPFLDNSIVTNSQRLYPISIQSAIETVHFLLANSKVKGKKEMAVHFIGQKKIAELHREFFNDPSPTDCITFSYNEPKFLGEVFVCPQIAAEYVAKEGGDISKEITLYIVHGFLHLLGFDDISENDRKIMRKEESKWMSALAKNNIGIILQNNV